MRENCVFPIFVCINRDITAKTIRIVLNESLRIGGCGCSGLICDLAGDKKNRQEILFVTEAVLSVWKGEKSQRRDERE